MGVVFEWAEFLVVAAVLALLLERTRITSENFMKKSFFKKSQQWTVRMFAIHREGSTNTAV